ncbi:MAG: hypothetical protein WBQ29_02430 [Isosphaeraceae bacterium]
MGRRISRNWKPTVEMVEHRELLSLVTDIMAGNHNALINSPKVRALLDGVSNPVATQAASASGQVTASATASSQGRLTPTSQSIALLQNQGFLLPASPGYNLVLQPTGTATPAEVKRQLFKAVYRGPYIIGPGSFSSQALQVFIRGAGTATTMLHTDIQMRLAVASDPTLETTGSSVIFDRNLNSNTVLGFDLATPRTNVDSQGRPNHITGVTLDVNASAGVYDEAFAQGVIDIHYYPTSKKIPGAVQQGTAVIKIYGQIYAPNVDFILRNSDINP